jgi:peptidyl-tRNA hydrolase, PTH1 family
MKMFVGLGNPGSRYERTRHNVGFMVIDELARRFDIDVSRSEKEALTGKGLVGGHSVMLVKPQTFMNLSGRAVSRLFHYYMSELDDLVVIYDEIDLELGRLRIRRAGSPGSHNGMKSIVRDLATNEFPRLRFGIKGETYSKTRDLAGYVLERFMAEEVPYVSDVVDRAADALVVLACDGIDRAMNEFNREPADMEKED